MRIRWTIVGFVVACAACSSDDDAGKGSGQLSNVGGADAGGAGGSAGSSPYSNGGAAVSCTTNEDCVTSAYVQPIASLDDCYCVACPEVALNVTTETERLAQWEEFCVTWVPPNSPDPCKAVKCAAPPESECKAGVCTLVAN
jgi:hypothetical protein